jgi:hypothetical protein
LASLGNIHPELADRVHSRLSGNGIRRSGRWFGETDDANGKQKCEDQYHAPSHNPVPTVSILSHLPPLEINSRRNVRTSGRIIGNRRKGVNPGAAKIRLSRSTLSGPQISDSIAPRKKLNAIRNILPI